ncbi:hypothetical protein KA005_46180 [bacterium]|nr:hypothetical protein [bacterium]
MSLRDYSAALRCAVEKLENYGFTEAIDIKEETRAGKQAIVEIQVTLVDGSVIHIKEYIDAKYRIEKLRYAYQYQDRDGGLIFRYDNAAHKPALGFKEHKHTSTGEVIKAASPDIQVLIDEVISCL